MSLMVSHQAHYLPSIEYLARVRLADTFIVADDVQFSCGDYQNRNRIRDKTAKGWRWLTLPLARPVMQFICDKRVSADFRGRKHTDILHSSYAAAPHWKYIEPLIERIHVIREGDSFAELCLSLLRICCKLLSIDTRKILLSSKLSINGFTVEDPSLLIAEQTRLCSCDTYACGQSGPDYLQPLPFTKRGIGIELMTWGPCRYSAPANNLSVVDLLAYTGPLAAAYLGTIERTRWL